jgi:hypothetical protein
MITSKTTRTSKNATVQGNEAARPGRGPPQSRWCRWIRDHIEHEHHGNEVQRDAPATMRVHASAIVATVIEQAQQHHFQSHRIIAGSKDEQPKETAITCSETKWLEPKWLEPKWSAVIITGMVGGNYYW